MPLKKLDPERYTLEQRVKYILPNIKKLSRPDFKLEDLKKVMQALIPDLTEADLQRLEDTDDNGHIDKYELEICVLFWMFDEDRDGFLSAAGTEYFTWGLCQMHCFSGQKLQIQTI